MPLAVLTNGGSINNVRKLSEGTDSLISLWSLANWPSAGNVVTNFTFPTEKEALFKKIKNKKKKQREIGLQEIHTRREGRTIYEELPTSKKRYWIFLGDKLIHVDGTGSKPFTLCVTY